MRVMLVRDDGTLGHQQDVAVGQVFVLSVQTSTLAEATLFATPGTWKVSHSDATLDLGDRLMVGWCVAFQAGWFVVFGAKADSLFAAAALIGVAAVWGALLRKVWRATA